MGKVLRMYVWDISLPAWEYGGIVVVVSSDIATARVMALRKVRAEYGETKWFDRDIADETMEILDITEGYAFNAN